MSHDTDKLIRQLSLVAFLMAERRPVTAREIKSTVEGYSEMSDEAFARRFYSDRSELLALGVPLHSQRDEFTGEELYTLRSEHYFLPALELTDDELAALQTALSILDGRFAYAEPLRLALQNLALGRGGFDQPQTETAARVEVRDPGYSPEMAGRLTKLETAISKQRTVRFAYWTIGRDETRERTVNPYALIPDRGNWYVVGLDLDEGALRTFRVSRVRGDIRFATRRERDFRAPEDFDPAAFKGRPEWQVGELAGEARIAVGDDTGWWAERAYAGRGHVEDGAFVTQYADIGQLARWVLRQDGGAWPLEPRELVEEVERALRTVAERHEGAPPEPAAEVERAQPPVAERSAGPVAPERFAVLQALLAYLLSRCGDQPSAELPAEEVEVRFHLTREELDEHLQLLNLVNFGGGCYAVYATLERDRVHVEKELFGDTFRRAPRLTPLEARAIRLALEYVGPVIAADAHEPLQRVRRKLEETFGQFDLAETPEPAEESPEEELVRTLSEGIDRRRLVEIEYVAVGEETTVRTVEPYKFERELPAWRIHTWDRTRDAPRTFRLDRMRRARVLDEPFEPRPGFDPQALGNTRSVRVWYSPAVARWALERPGVRPLADGAALEERQAGADWLTGEILSWRGEAVLLEPEDLRRRIAERAREVAQPLSTATGRRRATRDERPAPSQTSTTSDTSL